MARPKRPILVNTSTPFFQVFVFLIYHLVYASQWQVFGLSSCSLVNEFKTAVVLTDIKMVLEDTDPHPNIRVFQYMIICGGPPNIESLTIFLRLRGFSPINIVSQKYDWDRLAAVIHAKRPFPKLKLVEIIFLSELDISERAAADCQQIVVQALRAKQPKGKRTSTRIKVEYQTGDCDALTRAS